ncbi:MAG: HU family DNA-binding protein [Holosporales bacterium]|jgi:integration host factor subunit alpha|nr:HU family DNA-binding protein [Holosporales bacterium]
MRKSLTKTIIRAGLADSLSRTFKINRLQAEEFLETMLEEIGSALASGESVKLTNFGTLKLLKKKSRMGRNPKTLQMAEIKARRVVLFRPSSKLKARLNHER